MKKLLIGLFSLCVFVFNAPVSFASDGPETTKDCVIDNTFDVESNVVIDEVEFNSTKVAVVSVNHFGLVPVFGIIDCIEKSEYAIEPKDNRTSILEDYGVTKINFLNKTKIKTNGLAYKFIDKNCRTRQLTSAQIC